MMSKTFVIAVDIGGTNFRVALVNENVNIVRRTVQPTRPSEGFPKVSKRLIRTIRSMASKVGAENVRAIGVATAGPIDPGKGIILTPPSLYTWRNVPLRDTLMKAFEIPVWVEGDAEMAALGEHRFGAGRDFNRLIYITVSTGIGGGIIIDGQLLRGLRVSAAEVGHIVIDPNGPPCNCGGRGHVEAMASGTAIARMASEQIRRGSRSAVLDMCGSDPTRLTAEMVVQAARRGDKLANEVLREAGANLGLAVTSLIHIFDPDVVIIGGGVSNAGELLLSPVRETIARYTMADFSERAQIVRAQLGDDSGIIGAAAFALERVGIH